VGQVRHYNCRACIVHVVLIGHCKLIPHTSQSMVLLNYERFFCEFNIVIPAFTSLH
jgi:hypothetical protein